VSETPARFVSPGPHSEFYWTSGADGHLRVMGCDDCDGLHHPPSPVCPHCHSRSVEPKIVSGRGTVAGFTINHQPFMPGFEVPFAFGFIEIEEDPTIRISSNIVGCALEEIHVGMRVQVAFEANGDHHVPLFEPE
jgi:uncharacterized OB-fold protein